MRRQLLEFSGKNPRIYGHLINTRPPTLTPQVQHFEMLTQGSSVQNP